MARKQLADRQPNCLGENWDRYPEQSNEPDLLAASRLHGRAFFTICSNNYLPYAKVLFRSVKRFHPEASLFLCLADVAEPDLPIDEDGIEVIEARALGIPDFPCFAFRYNITEFNTALKPYMMLHLFEERRFSEVVYLDPDIKLFAPMLPVFEKLESGASFVLTPHVTKPSEHSSIPNDVEFLRSGVYNLGFFAGAYSGETSRLLHWWWRQLRFNCVDEKDAGLFLDQKFIDLLPGFSDRIAILRNPSINMAYWNLDQRHLRYVDGEFLVDDEPLIFFHFSGFDPGDNSILSKYTERFRDGLSPSIQNLVNHYISELQNCSYESVPRIHYAYRSFDDGVEISVKIRKFFRRSCEPWFGDPWKDFRPHLESISPRAFVSDHLAISNLMHYLWCETAELQDLFDVTTASGAESYLKWFVEWARLHSNIDENLALPMIDRYMTRFDRPRRSFRRSKLGSRPDVTVVGYLRAETGVGQAGRMVTRAALEADLSVEAHSTGLAVSGRQQDESLSDKFRNSIDGKVQILCINADQLAIVSKDITPVSRRSAFRINIPFWELHHFPDDWITNYEDIDEVWAPSRFVQLALFPKLNKPIIYMPLAVTLEESLTMSRREFQLPEDRHLFFCCFDSSSYMSRKNPHGVIDAYRRAFPHRADTRNVGLVIKSMGANTSQQDENHFMELVGDDPSIFLVNRTLSRSQTLNLMNCCDCVVSLHRSEGFGFVPAEAMLMEKPVIATNYGGSVDFLDMTCGYPIGYKLIPVGPDEYPLAAGQHWADPDLNHAAWTMRRVANDYGAAQQIAKSGRQRILADHSPTAVGRRYFGRLTKIGAI